MPFYIKINIGRAVIGRGSKISTVAFDIINEIDVLRLARLRPEYMKFIMQQLKKLYPFDYPFIEEKLLKEKIKLYMKYTQCYPELKKILIFIR